MSDLPLFGTNVDKSKVPPIHQKRIVNAFVNSFIVKTATFLDNFSTQVENKLLEFEIKLRQVDTQLKLIEAKLEKVPAVKGVEEVKSVVKSESVFEEKQEFKQEENVTPSNVEENIEDKTITDEVTNNPPESTPSGVKAKDDYRYKKYFKMIQFGVPPAAIKMKLQAEGMDPDILDNPDKVLPDGITEPIAIDSSGSESD